MAPILFNFKLIHMKTLHRIIDAVLYALWFSLFTYGAVNEGNMLIKVLFSICAFLIAAYAFMSIFYGIVRFKPKMFMIIPYLLLLAGMIYTLTIYGINPYNAILGGISIFGIAECIVNRKIEKLNKK